jgi:hypothetical protein
MDGFTGNVAGKPFIYFMLFQFSLKPIHPALITIIVPQCLSEIYSPQEDLLECLKDDVRGRDPLEAVGSICSLRVVAVLSSLGVHRSQWSEGWLITCCSWRI